MPRPDGLATCGEGGGASIYEVAIVTVNYSTKFNTNTLMDESLEPSAQFITISGSNFTWNSDGSGPSAGDETPDVQKIIRMVDWNVTLYNLSSLPSGLITMMGDVNSADITSSTLGCLFPAETLLYLGGSPSRTFTAQDASGITSPFWRLGMKFTVKKDSWNKFYSQGSDDARSLYRKGSGDPVIPYHRSNFVTGLNVNG